MTFSERLRHQRLSRGIDLAQIATDTKISKRHLEALESGDLRSIPGSIFARSFARQYARHVGLDETLIEEEIQAAFQQEDPFRVESSNPALIPAGGPPARDTLLSRIDFDWQRVPVPSVTLVAVLGACALLYMGWQRVVLGKGAASGPLASAPALPNPFAGAPSTKLPESASLPRPDAPAVPGMVSASTTPINAPGGALEIEVPQGGAPGMKIALIASQETWVSITANGKTVYTGILEPNSTRVLKGVERAKMVIGNAGGVDVLADDRTIGPIGPQGQVRVVLLSPEGPKIMKTAEERSEPANGSTGNETAASDSNKVAL